MEHALQYNHFILKPHAWVVREKAANYPARDILMSRLEQGVTNMSRNVAMLGDLNYTMTETEERKLAFELEALFNIRHELQREDTIK